jgi:manganese/zinc/iron transport system permease protein
VIVTIIGLQAVGLVLVIALLVIPAAAARFWTQDLKRMSLISAGIGAAGGLIGSAMSAVFPNLPSGAMIVLVCSSLFFMSMLLGTARGLVVRALRRRELNRSVDHQHLLRGLYELRESRQTNAGQTNHDFSELMALRSWSAWRLTREIERCRKAGYLVRNDDASLSLTDSGMSEASRLVHEHRLWELYLITHADVAPGRVDQSADAIEHVLEPELIARLEKLLRQNLEAKGVAPSPHPLEQQGGTP